MESRPAALSSRWRARVSQLARRRAFRAAAVASVLILALATNAFASIPDHSNVFHGCVQSGNMPLPNKGSLRLIDTARGEHCNQFESPVSWTENGMTGPTGATGATGPIGATGSEGAPGAAGPQGLVGETGPIGPVGPEGAVGPAGPAGAAGETGAIGPIGPAGPIGPQGPAGPAGPIGPEGAVGPAGPIGPEGAVGPAGPIGPEGAVGPAGPIGPQGPAGPAGPIGPAGETGPAGGISQYAYVYNTGPLTLILGGGIPFDTAGPISAGIQYNPVSGQVTFDEGGTYKVTYSLRPTTALLTSIALAVNGVTVPGSQFSASIATVDLTGETLVTVTAGDVLGVVNTGVISLLPASAPNVNAFLIIEKMSN